MESDHMYLFYWIQIFISASHSPTVLSQKPDLFFRRLALPVGGIALTKGAGIFSPFRSKCLKKLKAFLPFSFSHL